MMWVYFDERFDERITLEHGTKVRAGEVNDFSIFAYFENLNLIEYNQATISLKSPTGNIISNYSILGDIKSEEFIPLPSENSISPFEQQTYTGYRFDFDILSFFNVPGLWKATINLYKNSTIKVTGMFTFNVEESANGDVDDDTYIKVSEANDIIQQLSEKIDLKMPIYVRVLREKVCELINGEVEGDIETYKQWLDNDETIEFEPDYNIVFITSEKKFYKIKYIPAQTTLGETTPEHFQYEDIGIITSDKVPNHQTMVSLAINPTKNLNGREFIHYTAVASGNNYIIKYDGNNLTEEQAKEYLKYMNGSQFLPKYDYNFPKQVLLMFANNKIYKAQYDNTNGLVLYYVNQLALKNEIVVTSVNTKTGDVVLNSNDIKANNTQTIQQNLERIDSNVGDNRDDIEDLKVDKQDILTFDNTPTADSNNPVKSGGVYNAIQEVREVAEGKTNNYTLSYNFTTDNWSYCEKTDGTTFSSKADLETYVNGLTCANNYLNTQNNSVVLGGGSFPTQTYLVVNPSDSSTGLVIVKNNEFSTYFKQGDNLFIKETEVPDRWLSWESAGVLTAYVLETQKVILPAKTSDLVNDSGFSAVSGSHDGTNWTQITINGVAKSIPAGGGGSSGYLHTINAQLHINGLGVYQDIVSIKFYIINNVSTPYTINYVPLNKVILPIEVAELGFSTGNYWGFIHRIEEDDGFDDLFIECNGFYGSGNSSPSTFKRIYSGTNHYFTSISDTVTQL